jgi:hypothetical protein
MAKSQYIPPIPVALKAIRGLARTGIKYAEIGGGQDMPFEQAFSDIAHAYLRDKAPGLQDYEIGFQLIDRNQENTKAVGVFGFKVGPQWLYAPVFFLSGDVKGHELLYIKSQDMFVPLKENWLNYILNKRPNVLGHGIDRNLSQIGVMAPNLAQLSRTPSKFASIQKRAGMLTDALKGMGTGALGGGIAGALVPGVGNPGTPGYQESAFQNVLTGAGGGGLAGAGIGGAIGASKKHDKNTERAEADNRRKARVEDMLRSMGVEPKLAAALDKRTEWERDSLISCAHWATTHPRNEAKYKDLVDLPTFLKEAGYNVLVSLFKGFMAYPRVKAAFDQFHGLEVVEKAIAKAKEQIAASNSNSVLKEATCAMTSDGVRCVEPTRKHVRINTSSVIDDEVTPAAKKKPSGVNPAMGEALKESAFIRHPRPDPETERKQSKKRSRSNPALNVAIKEAKPAPVAIHTYDDVFHTGNDLAGLSKDEREKLLKDKILVRDARPDPEVSRVYEVQTKVHVFNPDKTGLYDVLIKPGEFVRCLVVMWPYSSKRRQTWCTVIRIDGNKGAGKSWLNVHPSHVWCGHWYPQEGFEKWVEGLEEPKDKLADGGRFVLISHRGDASCPFESTREIMSGVRSYRVTFSDFAVKSRPGWLKEIQDEKPSHDLFGQDTSPTAPRVTFTGKDGARMRCTGGDLMVPNGFKLITLQEPPKDQMDEEEGAKKDKPPMSSDPGDTQLGEAEDKDKEVLPPYSSDPAPLYLGDLTDIDYLVGTKTAAMKVAAAGSEVIINGHRMTKLGGLIHLIRDHGLREKQARNVLARAEAEKVLKCRIKYADQYYDLQKNGPNAPAMPEAPIGYDDLMGGNVPTQGMQEQDMHVPDMSAANTDRSVYQAMGPEPDYQGPPAPDRDTQATALQAAQTGQKEIFDTAMIGSLLKAVHDDNLVDRYMGDLMKGLDRLGRILFLFYWHNEKFAERYGQQDMVELEDGLRNAFEGTGDVTLFLLQRSVDPHNDLLNSPDIGSVAAA